MTPADCDASGRIAQTRFLGLFDRALWEALRRGLDVDVFAEHQVWPTARRATLDYVTPASAGVLLCFEISLSHLGDTSFRVRQTARRKEDGTVVAEAEFVFICLDSGGEPTPIPGALRGFFGAGPLGRGGALHRLENDGVELAVEVQGDGMPVLFIHGFPLDRTVWHPVMALLTGRRRIAPDLRGLGRSDAPDGGYSMERYADDMVAVLDTLGEERAVVCGLSMGGYIGFELLRRHPERVSALILVNSRAEADGPAARESREEMIRLVRDEGTEALADLLVPKLLAPESLSAMPQVADTVHNMIRHAPSTGIVGALRAMKDRPDSTEMLGTVAVPTMVVAGREDQLIPVDHARSMSRLIPNAHFTLIAGAGHLAPLEQPLPTSRVIAEFLDALA